jgi:hypothetical protein
LIANTKYDPFYIDVTNPIGQRDSILPVEAEPGSRPERATAAYQEAENCRETLENSEHRKATRSSSEEHQESRCGGEI